MKVLVCGGRDFRDQRLVTATLYGLCDEFKLWSQEDEYGNKLPEGITIVTGGARGADALAGDWAIVNWVPLLEFKADWRTYGNRAGPIRNWRMLEEKPDMVVAFPGGKGTAHMVEIARLKGVTVREVG